MRMDARQRSMKLHVCAHLDDLLIIGKPEAVQQLKRDMDTKFIHSWQATFIHRAEHHNHRFTQDTSVTKGI
jgi:hypothetical protein